MHQFDQLPENYDKFLDKEGDKSNPIELQEYRSELNNTNEDLEPVSSNMSSQPENTETQTEIEKTKPTKLAKEEKKWHEYTSVRVTATTIAILLLLGTGFLVGYLGSRKENIIVNGNDSYMQNPLLSNALGTIRCTFPNNQTTYFSNQTATMSNGTIISTDGTVYCPSEIVYYNNGAVLLPIGVEYYYCVKCNEGYISYMHYYVMQEFSVRECIIN